MTINRNELYKKKHGLLGMCIPGDKGTVGNNGPGMHIGFINDFFESFDISVNTVVKIAKRKKDASNNYNAWVNKQLLKFRCTATDNNTISVYDTPNITEEVFKNILNDSSNAIYYTGRIDEENYLNTEYQIDNQIGNTNIVNGIYTNTNNSSIFASDDSHNNVQLDSWEFHQIYDINYNGKNNYDLYEYNIDGITHEHHIKYDVHISYDTTTFEPEDIAKTLGYNSFLYPEQIYDYKWGVFYNFLTTNNGNILSTSSTHSDQGNAAFEKNLFDNKAKGVLTHIGIITPDNHTIQTTYNGHGVPQLIYMPLPPYLGNNNKNMLSQYVHNTVDIYPSYVKDAVIDAEGFTQVGVDLYNDKIIDSIDIQSDNNNHSKLVNTLNIKRVTGGLFYEFTEKNSTSIKKLGDNINVTVNKINSHLDKHDSSVKWFVDPFKNIKIPTTLKKDIQDGDILYFYTDSTQYNITGNIPYMVQVTPELRSCDINTLISHAITNPLQYKSIYTDNNNKNIQLYNNVTIMYGGNSYQDYVNKANIRSLNNILTYNNKSILHLPSVKDQFNNYNFINYISHENLNKINNNISQQDTNIKSLNINAYIRDNDDIKYIIDIKSSTVQFSDLYVNNSTFGNIIPEGVFDNNIITEKDLYNSLCLKPITLDNFQIIPKVKKNERYDILQITLDKTKYITNDIEKYYIGCIITNEKGKIIYQYETQDNISILTPNFITQFDNITITELICKYQILLYIRHNNKFKRFAKLCQLSYTLKQSAVDCANITDLTLNTLDENYYAINDDIITNNNDIKIDINGITCEKNSNIILKIQSNNQNLIIDKIYFNNAPVHTTYEEVQNMIYANTSIGNTWFTVHMNQNKLLPFHLKQYPQDKENRYATYEYNLDINDNIPNIITLNGNTNVHTVNINDYMTSLSNEVSEQRFIMEDYSNITGRFNDIIECDLFKILNNKHNIASTASRDIKLNMLYHIADISNNIINNNIQYKKLSAQYNITQPGFTDPRTLPVFKFETYNSPDIVETINAKLPSNNYIHITKLTIENFGYENWGKFIKNKDDVTISFTIKNLDYDIEWKERLQLENTYKRPTFKFIPEDKNHKSEPNKIDCYTKIAYALEPMPMSYDNIERYGAVHTESAFSEHSSHTIKQEMNILNSYIDQKKIQQNTGSSYIVCEIPLWDENILNVCKTTEEIYSGIYLNTTINFNNLTIDDIKNGIYIMNGIVIHNPIIGNMYLRYYIDKFTITYNVNNKKYNFTSSVNQSVDTYLHTTEGNKDNYRFISDKIDVMFNPISYVICPEEEETNILPIKGNVKKESSDALISSKISLFMPEIYDSDIVNIPKKEQRQKQLFSWDGLLLKKSSFNDNIQSIKLSKNDQFNIGVIYNNTIMNPKIRNNKNTFYYNDEEYDADRYNQYKLNGFIPVSMENSWELRTDSIMDAIDVWNYEYQNNEKLINSSNNTPYKGILNMYGNGYMYMPDNCDENQYGNKIVSLKDVKQDGNVLLHKISNIKPLEFSEPKNENYPETNGYKRAFLWNIGVLCNNDGTLVLGIPESYNVFMTHYTRTADNYLNNFYDSMLNYFSTEKYGEHHYNNEYINLKLTPHIAYNSENNNINVLMLRSPCIGKDELNLQDALYNYTLKKRFYELSDNNIDFDKCFYQNRNTDSMYFKKL